MLRKFSGSEHPNMISLLATYEQSNKFNLIFPWAKADLLRYWKTVNPKPRFDKTTVLWFAEQCRGIASGLSAIHRYGSGESLPSLSLGDPAVYARHGDIKPENILWFPEADSSLVGGTLKLSDFGTADLAIGGQETMAFSPTYRAPEIEIPGSRIGRAYDMWSLGCLYLDFITWLLGGWEMVDVFGNGRLASGSRWHDIKEDSFFQPVKHGDHELGFVIKPAVTEVGRKLVMEVKEPLLT